MVRNVLVIGDSDERSGEVEHFNTQSNGSYQFYFVKRSEYQTKIQDVNPHCLLLDSSIFQHDEPKQFLQLISQHKLSGKLPVILLMDEQEIPKFSEVLKSGIADFIVKPLNKDELIQRFEMHNAHQPVADKNFEKEETFVESEKPEAKTTINTLVLLCPDGQVEWVNEGFKQMYGYAFNDYISRFEHYVFSKNGGGFQLAMQQFKGGKTGFTFEHQIETRSSELKWIQTTVAPLYGDQGEIDRVIVIETDITRLRHEKRKTEELLSNILPYEIIEQLKLKGKVKSKRYKRVTVLFADFKNFTTLTKTMAVDDLISQLNHYVKKFDEIIERHYIEKIKTMGDAYMCAGGLPLKNYSNPFDVTLASLEIQKFVKDMANERILKGGTPWELRLGIHTGEVMAGVIGTKKFAYDIWGNTVNVASRMEETSQVGKVSISETTYSYIQEYFDCTYRGKVSMKNIPDGIDMYYVNRLKPEFSEDEQGIFPNAAFRKILAAY
jgi:class 3 adenylate cyclase/PAS domain-containing protein